MPKSRKTKKYFSLFDFLIFGRMPFQLSIRNSFFQLRKLGPLKLLCQLRALLDVALKFILCFHAGQDCVLLTRFANNILDLQLSSSILGALCAGMLDSTRCFHVCTAMHGLRLKCSTRGFPSYRGLIWFSCGLGGSCQNLPQIAFQPALHDSWIL